MLVGEEGLGLYGGAKISVATSYKQSPTNHLSVIVFFVCYTITIKLVNVLLMICVAEIKPMKIYITNCST